MPELKSRYLTIIHKTPFLVSVSGVSRPTNDFQIQALQILLYGIPSRKEPSNSCHQLGTRTDVVFLSSEIFLAEILYIFS